MEEEEERREERIVSVHTTLSAERLSRCLGCCECDIPHP